MRIDLTITGRAGYNAKNNGVRTGNSIQVQLADGSHTAYPNVVSFGVRYGP